MNFLLTAVLSKLWSGIYGIKSIICISQIPRYASLMYATYFLVMCRSQYLPNFSKKKTVRIEIQYLALKKISYFWFPQGMIIFPGGVRQKRNFRRGGGVRFVSQFLENPEGRGGHRKNPFRGGGYGYFLELHILRSYKIFIKIF